MLIVPTFGLSVHVIAVLEVLATVAVNCCVPLATRLTAVGATVRVTGGISVTVAVADLVVSALLVAITTTDCVLEIEVGAVYIPLVLIAPTLGLIVHPTPVVAVLVTAAVNCWV